MADQTATQLARAYVNALSDAADRDGLYLPDWESITYADRAMTEKAFTTLLQAGAIQPGAYLQSFPSHLGR